ncbi:type II toxin-antitoxin system Rv0910 family toxin [Kibdelosporangium phytohabitans]|uniref:Polyketide cyclase n=1 Tax=Kibdelosporangium phytohabitans TaxID=860235 RepID=A0A0N9HLE8_9PSEU|nr:SRPBCC family protein [Kibdelosporangium phytohabitans]ALG07011.1 polyketide cyclase [Kibdelosporangium phytohabitans]MBE1468302.1 carbon monoxide dehydrogenase subunit G [Kibdelosporangium phytohabitans]
MITIEKTTELPASAEKIWSAVSDLARWEDWLTIHQKWKSDLPAEISLGTKVTGVASVLNMPNTIEWTVDEWDVPNKLAISGKGMAGVEVAISLAVSPHGDGSKLVVVSSFAGQMIVGAIAGAIERASRQELDTSLANLAKLVA